MAKRKIRVVQYGVGPIGASVVRLMRTRNALELAGAIDKDPAKIGKDLGQLVGAEDAPWGITVSGDAAEVLGQGVDLVMHCTSSYLKEVAGQLFECIQAGCCVVSTCEELAYPFRKYPEISAKLDSEAKEWGVALVGTGVNPGFIMDKMVLTAGAAAQQVDSVRVVRVVDAAKRRLPLQKKIGAGMSPEEFRDQVAAGVIKHHGLPESVAMVADGLGFELDDIIEKIEPVIADSKLSTEFLIVEAGQVAGVQQVARGVEEGIDKIYMELRIAVGAGPSYDSIEVSGVPNMALTVPGGLHGDLSTAAIAVNAIPVLLEANAGLRTSRDLPMCYFPPAAQP